VELESELIDWTVYTETRSALGPDFVRILGYFREDGTQSVAQIEAAMRERDAAKMVIPAHTLKGEAAQFGAVKLSAAAEAIELTARKYVEYQQSPEELLEPIVALRPMFEETLADLDRESSPVIQRQANGFGRRASGF
jgi:HPt (histidine-containing phosphotransfer) domain-containing protein